jgi:hypothetical protein
VLIPFGTSNSINGMFLDVVVSGAVGQPLSIAELTPLYDLGEELRVDFTAAQLALPN